jgi:hypothetical protein
MTLDDRRRARAASVITEAWPGELGETVLHAVQDLEAFGALAYKLDRARLDGADPVAILHLIDTGTLEWAITEANNPAAFLASRITTDTDEQDDEEQW